MSKSKSHIEEEENLDKVSSEEAQNTDSPEEIPAEFYKK